MMLLGVKIMDIYIYSSLVARGLYGESNNSSPL